MILVLVVLVTSIGVGVDASNLKVRRGALNSSFVDMGPLSWTVCCLLLWIIAFPAYLITRPRYVELSRGLAPSPFRGPPYSAPQFSTPVPAPAPAGGVAEELTHLSALRGSGALSESEFQQAKAAVLGGRPQA